MFDAQIPLQWTFLPSVAAGLALLSVAYLTAVGPWRTRFAGSRPVARGRLAAFLLAITVSALALLSPIAALSDGYLFSAHMLQHMLLTLVMPPLLLSGLLGWLLRPPLSRWPWLLAAGRAITNPIAAFALFNALFLGYHVPALYNAVQESVALHALAHLAFMVAGVITWWPVLSPLPELPPLAPPLQLLYLFLQTLPSQVLGALLTFTSRVYYQRFAAAPRVWDWLDPARDQQLGALLMWVAGGTFFLGAFALVFLRWAQAQEVGTRPRALSRR